MPEKNDSLIEQIKGVLTETVAPLEAKIESAVASVKEELKGEIAGLRTEVDQKLAASKPAAPEVTVRRDMEGKEFRPFQASAPAYVKDFGDRPLMLVDVARMFAEKDDRHCSLLVHVDNELQKLGHTKTLGNRSVMFPLTPGCVPDAGSASDALRKLLKDAMVIHEDFGFAGPMWRKYAGQMISKQMDPNDDSLGGSLIPLPDRGDLIELFRAVTVMGRVGAEQIVLPPQGSIRYPRETGTTTFYWLDSNDTITASTASTGSLQLTAKRLAGLMKVPNDLIRYGMNVEGLLRRSLALDAGLAEDLAILEGEGGGQKPLGIIRYGRSTNDTPTQGFVTLHNAQTTAANGDTFGVEDPTEMIGLVETANDAEGANAFVMRPMMLVAIANRRLDQGGGAGTGAFAFPDVGTMTSRYEKRLRGLPVVVSTQVNATSRKGSGTTLTYVLCGNFRRVVVGRVGAVELAASEHAGFDADQVWIRAILRMDAALRKPESVVMCPTLLES